MNIFEWLPLPPSLPLSICLSLSFLSLSLCLSKKYWLYVFVGVHSWKCLFCLHTWIMTWLHMEFQVSVFSVQNPIYVTLYHLVILVAILVFITFFLWKFIIFIFDVYSCYHYVFISSDIIVWYLVSIWPEHI